MTILKGKSCLTKTMILLVKYSNEIISALRLYFFLSLLEDYRASILFNFDPSFMLAIY